MFKLQPFRLRVGDVTKTPGVACTPKPGWRRRVTARMSSSLRAILYSWQNSVFQELRGDLRI
ncbi:MAG: hypothetical protein ACYTFY_20220 [Planctomycetota bacterium]